MVEPALGSVELVLESVEPVSESASVVPVWALGRAR